MKCYIIFLISFLLFISCQEKDKITLDKIKAEQSVGNFSEASKLIDRYIAQNELSEEHKYELEWQKDKMQRIANDFKANKEQVLKSLQVYYPYANDDSLQQWEENKLLEFMIIDGDKKYFNRAVANLFRLDDDARKKKEAIDGIQENNEDKTLKTFLPQMVSSLRKENTIQSQPVAMKVKYAITLKSGVVPDGKVVRCWMPYPRVDESRQSNVSLLLVSDSNYIISPSAYAHSSIYLEKAVKGNEPLSFSVEFSYSSVGEWFNMSNRITKPYDTNDELYRIYTAERPPHIVFTDSIKTISARIIGSETQPYEKVKRIFYWIDQNFPWAGAREYSTLDNIPAYVLENRHGDCGQVTLLFMTLARYNGIPTRWQSGFMMYPDGVNLHDWAEYYCEGVGWIPVDQSFGPKHYSEDRDVTGFFSNGIDPFRMVINNDYSRPLFPSKIYPRSETVDFQRGELEWEGGNIYFNKWDWDIEVDYIN